MQLTEQHILPKTAEVDLDCFKSKHIYNASLYVVRQHYFENKEYIGLKALQEQMKTQECFRELPIKVSQLVVKQVHDNCIAYFKALKAYKLNPSNFIITIRHSQKYN